MGNEQSKSKELHKNGKIPEKQDGGLVNGVSTNITESGKELNVNGVAIIKQNGGPHSSEVNQESYVVVESVCQEADTPPPVSTESPPHTTIQKEEVKKVKEEKSPRFGKMFKKNDASSAKEKETVNEDQTDASLPDAVPQPDSSLSGDNAATMTVTEHRDDSEYLQDKDKTSDVSECRHNKTETSTQTETIVRVDVSTQTGVDDAEASEEEGTATQTEEAEGGESLNSPAVVAEEVNEVAEEPVVNPTAGIITEEVVIMASNAYRDLVFRAERIEVTDNSEIRHIKFFNHLEDGINDDPESNPDKCITEDESFSEENNIDEAVPLQFSSSLPKVVADCVEAVFSGVSDVTAAAVANVSEPSTEEVAVEETCKDSGYKSDEVVLIEIAETECNVVTPQAGETDKVPSLEEESPMSEIPQIDPFLANQCMPAGELLLPLVTETGICAGTSNEELKNEVSTNEPTTEELEEALNSPDEEVQIETILEVMTADYTADVEKETAEEGEQSPVIVMTEAEVVSEAAIQALSHEFNVISFTSEEHSSGVLLEEEVISATVFLPLHVVPEVNLITLEETSERNAEELIEEAIEALSIELEAVPECVKEDTPGKELSKAVPKDVISQPYGEDRTTKVLENKLESVAEAISLKSEVTENKIEEPTDEGTDKPHMDTTGESELCALVQEKLVEENIEPNDPCLVVSEEPADMEAEKLQMNTTKQSEFCVFSQEKHVEENIVLLEEETIPATVFVQRCLIPDTNLITVEETSEANAEENIEEAMEPLSIELEGVPECVKEDISVQESSSGEVTVEPEPAEEKAEVPKCVVNPRPCGEDPTTEVLENLLESVIENKTEEPADEQQMDTTRESEFCVLAQEKLVDKNNILLEEEAIPVTAFLPHCMDPEVNLITLKETRETTVLSVDLEAVPECIKKDTSVQESSSREVIVEVRSEEPFQEKAELPRTVVDSRPMAEDPATDVLKNKLESVVEASSLKSEVTENVIEKPADEGTDEPHMDTTRGTELCAVVQEELEGENISSSIAAVVEPNDSCSAVSEDPADVQADKIQMDATDDPEFCTLVQEKLVEENIVLLEEETTPVTAFLPHCVAPDVNLITLKETRETTVLPIDLEAVPECVKKDTSVQESSSGEVTVEVSSEEPVQEKAELPRTVVDSSPCAEDPATEVLMNKLESVVEASSLKSEVTENVIEEPADEGTDEPHMDTTRGTEFCVLVQEKLVEEDIRPSIASVVEPNDSCSTVSEDPADVRADKIQMDATKESEICILVREKQVEENIVTCVSAVVEPLEPAEECASRLKPQLPTLKRKTIEIEIRDEITITEDHFCSVFSLTNDHFEGSEIVMSYESAAECTETVLETIVEEDGEVECAHVTCEQPELEITAVPETLEKTENVSSDNSAQSKDMAAEASPKVNMEALFVRLQSACASAVVESACGLDGLSMFSDGNHITVTINVAPKKQEHENVEQLI